MLKPVVLLWPLFLLVWCNASIQQFPNELLIRLSDFLPPLDTLNLRISSKWLYRKLFNQIIERFFYEDESMDGLVLPRLSLEKIFEQWMKADDALKPGYECFLKSHKLFNQHSECLLKDSPFAFGMDSVLHLFSKMISAEALAQSDFCRWIVNQGPAIDRPLVSLLLKYGLGVKDTIDGQVMAAAAWAKVRPSVYKCLWSEAVKNPQRLSTTFPSNFSSIFTDRSYAITMFKSNKALLFMGFKSPNRLFVTLEYAKAAGLPFQKMLKMLKLSHPPGSQPSKYEASSAVERYMSYKELDGKTVVTILKQFPNGWKPTPEFIAFLIKFLKFDELGQLLEDIERDPTAELSSDVVDSLISNSCPLHIIHNLLLKFAGTRLDVYQCQSLFRSDSWSASTLLIPRLLDYANTNDVDADWVSQNFSADVFMAWAFHLNDCPQLLEIMMKRQMPPESMKLFLRLQGHKHLNIHSFEDCMALANSYGYDERLTDFFVIFYGYSSSYKN